MLQLGGVWCDVIGVCLTYLDLAGAQTTLPQFHQGNVFLTFPQMSIVFSYLLFGVLIRNIPAGFFVNVWVEALTVRIVVSDGSSVLCSLGELGWHRQYWLRWWPYDQMIIQGAVQYSVYCTISYSRKPGVVLKAMTCPGLSHVSVPRSRACTSKSDDGSLSRSFIHKYLSVLCSMGCINFATSKLLLDSDFLELFPIWIPHPFIHGSIKSSW